ncbi:hypothetical protein [Planctomicrobium sp. SH664]|uniref:hypothetical protein n=1 Tax=Planctomicrobium sp. SH664 TaxID=3448125 RepID=UPI003F5B2CDB
MVGSALDEARWCLSVCTCPEFGEFHADRLRDCFERRERLLELQSEMELLLSA